MKYAFKFNTVTPSTCYEIFTIKKLANLLTSDPVILKEYIDWVFKDKLSTKCKSVNILCKDAFVQEFKSLKFKDQELTRSSVLPESYQSIFLPDKIVTYGDLALMFNTAKDTYSKQFEQLSKVFNLSLLEKIV